MSQLLATLSGIVGEDRLITGDAIAERATSYWNSAPMHALAIACPATTEEVSAVLRACHDNDQTVVTQGGLTNCVAAAEPAPDDVVISLEKMRQIVNNAMVIPDDIRELFVRAIRGEL